MESMEHLLPHEITKRELEMHEAVEIEQRGKEELRVAEDEVRKSLDKEQDDDAVAFSRVDAESTNGGMLPRQVIDISSYTSQA
ncbi:hypothetical protein ZWY2020_056797 [Hordeum vulgare]|nr:hypothetical protein ZWY2020_056797 [Hordeum vulgare]